MSMNTDTTINQDLVGSKKEKRKKTIQRLIVALLLLLLSIMALHRLGFIRFPWETERMVVGNVNRGSLPGLSDEELLAALQSEADENNVAIQLNGRPVFENGESEGSLFLGNLEGNSFDKHVEIIHIETGEPLYDSGIIPPGYHIANDSLLEVLEQGSHLANAIVTFYDGEEVVSQTNFNIEIVVKS